jgi:Mg2+ and Co2+ transporter CorA
MSDFNQKLSGAFYDIFNRIVRRSLDQKEVDMLQRTSSALAKVITEQANRAALERCKKLNDATQEGFDNVFKDITELREILTSTHEALKELLNSFKDPLGALETLPDDISEDTDE